MSDKLYLIRVDMERFLGPMTLREVRESYRRMEFDLQDEIASSNRQWVSFDDLERIKRYYPELVGIIKKEMLYGWGTTSSSAIKINKIREQTLISTSKKTWISRAILLFSVSSISFLLVFFIKEERFHNLKYLFKEPLISQAIILYGNGYNPHFESFMDRNFEEISSSLKNKEIFDSWLPYIRSIAYSRDGTWGQVPAKALKGKETLGTPMDCSLQSWRKNWESGQKQWLDFLNGQEKPNADWAKIMLWDMEWIASIKADTRQWLYPRNYYEACLLMSLKALNEVSKSNQNFESTVFQSRLRWQLSILSGEEGNSEFQMSGILWALSCIESSDQANDIQHCTKSLKLNKEWRQFLENRGNLREGRGILSESTNLGKEQLARMQSIVNKISSKDPMIKFDYSEEKKLFQTVIDNGGNVSEAKDFINEQSQIFNFKY